jgi:PPK2 family polyphosphate:nucleotide phosphotransferase
MARTQFMAPQHPSLVPFDGSFRVSEAPTQVEVKDADDRLDDLGDELEKLQRALFAMNRWAVLLVFQGIDAAGKDSTIRAVMSKMNPAGIHVRPFGPPTDEELDHDFLWRITAHLPERGQIGVFNRSHYEEVLAVRVHPEFLDGQRLPFVPTLEQLWDQRYESIRDYERHLARNGVAIVKFWLNVSKEEQRERFLSRLDDPSKYWKFNEGDIRERGRWDDYQAAFEGMVNATSRPWAPWYAIPADDKPSMRATVAEILVATLESLELEYPPHDLERPVEELRRLIGD